MTNIVNFKGKKKYKTFFIEQYFLFTSRLLDWTLQYNPVNPMDPYVTDAFLAAE